jgi:hypothetical protein
MAFYTILSIMLFFIRIDLKLAFTATQHQFEYVTIQLRQIDQFCPLQSHREPNILLPVEARRELIIKAEEAQKKAYGGLT